MTAILGALGPIFDFLSKIIGPLGAFLVGRRLGEDRIVQQDTEKALKVASDMAQAGAESPRTKTDITERLGNLDNPI